MNILILGATGMLGHKLLQVLQSSHHVEATCRQLPESLKAYPYFDSVLPGYEAHPFEAIEQLLRQKKYDVVINCIGIIKQLKASYDPIPSLEINSLFPHRVNKVCQEVGSRFIHISTDCVFSGSKGNYSEQDEPDAKDLYGKSKELGEVKEHGLTIRTSIIGHEITSQLSLVNWFLSQEGKVNGYRNAIYTGMPTVSLARIILQIIETQPALQGLYQVASAPINKYDLLKLITADYRKDIEIEPYDDFVNDKSLQGQAFEQTTGIKVPSWPELIHAMHEDFVTYEDFYRTLNPALKVHQLG
jgi:dTDP-4-dehydrorhamnose reductase